jgi:phosphoribosylaminoimidazole-succinocarboxamide synthase
MEQVRNMIGDDLTRQVRDASLQLYTRATEFARSRGIIIADTKFEFGLDASGTLRVMDEVLTPDSSRFWPADTYKTGSSPPSFDKQYIRDYLETLDWNKQPPGPKLPGVVIERTRAKYIEALQRLTSERPA